MKYCVSLQVCSILLLSLCCSVGLTRQVDVQLHLHEYAFVCMYLYSELDDITERMQSQSSRILEHTHILHQRQISSDVLETR